MTSGPGHDGRPLLEVLQNQQRQRMDQLVEPLAHRYQSAHVTKIFEDISPGKGLTELSREAQLVVVGSSGHGRLAETILGSGQSESAPPRRMPAVGGPVADIGDRLI